MTVHARRFLSLAALALLAGAASSAFGQANIEIVARVGAIPPGATRRFNDFKSPSINDDGDVFFPASLNAQGLDVYGLWAVIDGTLTKLIADGDPAPGLPGFEFGRPPGVSARVRPFDALPDGSAVFGYRIFPSGSTGGALDTLWSQTGPTPTLLLGDGVADPASSGVLNIDRTNYTVNASGRYLFPAIISGGALNGSSGFWASTGDGLIERVMVDGEVAPGTDGALFGGDPLVSFFLVSAINDENDVIFGRSLVTGTTPPVDATNDYGFWVREDNTLRLLAREGDLAPGAGGARFGVLKPGPADVARGLNFGSGATTAFLAFLTGDGVTTENNRGIWSGDADELTLVARTGSQAPTLDPGVVFDGFPDFIVMNASGTVAFVGVLDGPGITEQNDSAVWVGLADAIVPLIREGDQLPQAQEGVVIDGFSSIALNSQGHIVVRVSLRGPGIEPATNGVALIGIGADTQLRTIARWGDPIITNGGAPDTFAVGEFFYNTSSRSNGMPSGFNENGQLALMMTRRGGPDVIARVTLESINVCTTDFDGDGDTDLGDFGLFGASFGSVVGDATYNAAADLDDDGDVDLGDFGIFGSEFGRQDCIR